MDFKTVKLPKTMAVKLAYIEERHARMCEASRQLANAERMAAALEAISRLSETKLSVAVFSGGKAA